MPSSILRYILGLSLLQLQGAYGYNDIGRCHGVDILELTIDQFHKSYQSKGLSSYQLVECYLERIKLYNPMLHAVIETNTEALIMAKKLDDYWKSTGKFMGPLHGVPILVKDNIATTEGNMSTTAGSYALVGAKPKKDATVISKLKKAGAIILGKANLSEFAGFRSESHSSGWSGRGGQTRNTYWLDGTTSGSSSGSAVAVGANLCLGALGTETDGSIIGPSSVTATVGLKPTVGYTSNAGIIPLAPSQDSVGAITRTVEDNLKILRAIAEPKLAKLLYDSEKIDPKKLRVGVLRETYFNAPMIEKQTLYTNTTIKLLDKYVRVIDNLSIDLKKLDSDLEYIVIKTEFKHYLNEYLKNEVTFDEKNTEYHITSLQKIIEFNKAHKKLELERFDQKLLIETESSPPITDAGYINARDKNMKNSRALIDELLEEYRLDGLLVPSDHILGAYSVPAVAGYPIITVPQGVLKSRGAAEKQGSIQIPFGLSIYGTEGSEGKLLAIAKVVEKLNPTQRPLPDYI